MRPSITAERGIVVGIVVALALQAVNGYFAYRAATDYVQSAQDRRASLNILQHSEGYLSLLKDAETGQRGFVLTADPSYLNPYEKAVAGLSAARDKFHDAARTDYAEVLAEVDRLTNEFMAELGEAVDLQSSDPVAGQAAAQALVKGGIGKRAMDELRGIISDLEDRERVRLGRIGETMDSLARNTPTMALLVSSLAVVLVGGAGWIAYRDVRRRTAAEAKVREQRTLLDSILDNISDGVLVADAQGSLLLVNAAAQRMHKQDGTGTPSTQWNRRFGLYRLDRETLVPNDELPLARAVRGEAVDRAELYLKPPESDEGIYLGISGRPLHDERGRLRGGVIVMRNITDQKQAEQRAEQMLAELERRVIERTAELSLTNDELQQQTQENETFVYSVSHDLRSPLVNLQGFSQELALSCKDLRALLQEADVPDAVRTRGLRMLDDDFDQSIRYIQSAVLRLADIINALLKLSRAGRIEYQVETVSLDEIVARIVESLQSETERRGASIQVQPLPSVLGDQLAIEQVFANLLDNAVKYLDPSRPGEIVVGVLEDESATGFRTFFVRDNGLGVPEQGREKVFKAFERFHGSVAPGEGMGLAIVKRIVNRHGGEIRLESSPGEGCVFYVSLPVPPKSVAVSNTSREETSAPL